MLTGVKYYQEGVQSSGALSTSSSAKVMFYDVHMKIKQKWAIKIKNAKV
jgi:hypothetical protein